jgi:hypothetical protein
MSNLIIVVELSERAGRARRNGERAGLPEGGEQCRNGQNEPHDDPPSGFLMPASCARAAPASTA